MPKTAMYKLGRNSSNGENELSHARMQARVLPWEKLLETDKLRKNPFSRQQGIKQGGVILDPYALHTALAPHLSRPTRRLAGEDVEPAAALVLE